MTVPVPSFWARFGGVDWCADLPLDPFDEAPAGAPDPVVVSRLVRLDPRPALARIGRASIATDGVRFDWADEVVLDMVGGTRIGWSPGPGWRGVLPATFFSSMAAITLAWRGLLPLHASAVVLGGRAWLIAGTAGAGKSTLTAELLDCGAQFLADDLTVLSHANGLRAWRGRPAMRLHPATAQGVATRRPHGPPEDARGKLLVWPAMRAADQAWALGGLLLLGGAAAGALPAPEAAAAYGSILFRPKILAALPDRARLRGGLFALARGVPVALLPAVQGFDASARAHRLAAALAAIERLGASG